MQGKFKKLRLVSRISKERLNSYGYLDEQSLDPAIAKYLWNCTLSESLYESLHWLEISLRNSIHAAATQAWGVSWLTNGHLLPPEQGQVDDAIARLKKEGKNTSSEDIIAALNFGFWTSLFRKDYENKLRPLLIKIFPYVTPTSDRTRKHISDRLNNIRKFRNRIFHFEPIIKYKPEVRYGEIKQTIEWMAPEINVFLEMTCSFSAEFTRGESHYLADVSKVLVAME